MLTKKRLLLAECLTVAGMLVAACAPAAAPPQTPEAPAPIPTTVGTPGPAATPKTTAEEPRYGGTLTVYTPRLDPKDLDLISDHTMPGLTKIRAAYSGLLQYDPLNHGKIIPDLAERWEATPDGKSYTFFLRKGVKWHDGQPFSSADVKYTLLRTIDPNDPEKIRLMTKREAMSGITSVETPDADTVRVNLQLPRGSFIPWTAWGPMVMGPKHIPIGGLANTAVGTGAFKFKSYLRSSSLDLAKNPDYFIKGRPYLDGLTFYIIKDITTTMAAFRTRRILLARDFLPSKAREVKVTRCQPVQVQLRDQRSHLSGPPLEERQHPTGEPLLQPANTRPAQGYSATLQGQAPLLAIPVSISGALIHSTAALGLAPPQELRDLLSQNLLE